MIRSIIGIIVGYEGGDPNVLRAQTYKGFGLRLAVTSIDDSAIGGIGADLPLVPGRNLVI
ncbi:hypothetical protein OK016_04340 [Vibrio chagasii]|nr:hypothetical protein [Vibrio chagasii]